jgi:hypothetical protein
MHRIRLGQAIDDGEIALDIYGHTGIVRSRPKPNGTPGPEIVVGRAAPAGALGVRNVRIEPFIATRLPD